MRPNVRSGSMLLKKSFLADERNFSEPLMRFARRDVRDHNALHKNDHGLSYRSQPALSAVETSKHRLSKFPRKGLAAYLGSPQHYQHESL